MNALAGLPIRMNRKAGLREGQRGHYVGGDPHVRELHRVEIDGRVHVYLWSAFDFEEPPQRGEDDLSLDQQHRRAHAENGRW